MLRESSTGDKKYAERMERWRGTMVERERECTFKNRLKTGKRNTGASSEDRVGIGQGVDEVLVKISGCAQKDCTVSFKIEERTDITTTTASSRAYCGPRTVVENGRNAIGGPKFETDVSFSVRNITGLVEI
jgi:hypothetical protein